MLLSEFRHVWTIDFHLHPIKYPISAHTDKLKNLQYRLITNKVSIINIVNPTWVKKHILTWKCPQAIQDVDELVSSSEQIWRNVALYHLLTNGSSAVNGCRQNHHNNPQVIHTTQIHQLMSCEVESRIYVRNKSIIKMFFNFKPSLLDKKSRSPSPVVLHIKISSELLWTVFTCKWCLICAYFWYFRYADIFVETLHVKAFWIW